ncbi:MAG: hypothetical protein IRY90_03860 [Actinomadura rubrobrunea]|nr:hypothetical protein [Actinomadura rubrobrunea]
MTAVLLACAAQVVYIVAFVVFKTATRAMSPLTGRRPLAVMTQALSSGCWLLGLLLLVTGFAMGDIALLSLPLAAALPAYGFGLVLVLVVGHRWFGERFAGREWLGMLLTVAAMTSAAASVALKTTSPGFVVYLPTREDALAAPDALPWTTLAAVVVPSLAIPLWMFTVRDRAVEGRHARRLTGIAYGVGAGVLLGTAEVFGLGTALTLADGRLDVHLTPHPYLFLLAGVFGLALLSIGLQRCRLSLFVTVLTLTAKIHLLLSATLIFGEPWPQDRPLFLLRVGAVALAMLAVLTFPRHERRRTRPSITPQPKPRYATPMTTAPSWRPTPHAHPSRHRRNQAKPATRHMTAHVSGRAPRQQLAAPHGPANTAPTTSSAAFQ